VGWREFVEMICPTGEAKYFCKVGWTRLSTNRPTGKSADRAVQPWRGYSRFSSRSAGWPVRKPHFSDLSIASNNIRCPSQS
jgi:hypothetical protein